MADRNFLPRCTAFFNQIPIESLKICNSNAMHLGKKFLAAIFSAILYLMSQFITAFTVHTVALCNSLYYPKVAINNTLSLAMGSGAHPQDILKVVMYEVKTSSRHKKTIS